MSEPVSALDGATSAEGIAEIRDAGLHGMITLRGDLSAAAVKKAVKSVAGVDVPDTWKIAAKGEMSVAWMSPDEVLILCPYDDAKPTLAKLQKALGKAHALAVNVSDARAVFEVKGPHARDVLAKLTPANVAPEAFGAGDFRRSRLAQVAGAFWMSGEDTIRIVCFRSVAQYMFDLLETAAQPGSEVNYF